MTAAVVDTFMVELFRVHQQLGNKRHNIVFNTRICKGNGESMSIGLYHSGHCVIGMKGNMATINCVEKLNSRFPEQHWKIHKCIAYGLK